MTHADSSLRLLGRSRDTGAGAALPPTTAFTQRPAPYMPGMDLKVYGVSAVDGARYELPLAEAGTAAAAGCPVADCDCEQS